MAKVFISYRRLPSAMLATLIAKELESRGVEVYVDTRKGDGGGPFPRHLLQAIENSDIFVCLLADTTFASDWVKREIDHAFTMGKIMIPVFQESFRPLPETPDTAIEMLLMSQGVHVLDQQNIYVDEALERLVAMIASSVPETGDYRPSDTTEIGARTFNLRPQQNKSRRWLWIVAALVILLSGIVLSKWLNFGGDDVAGTQTALALAALAIDTPTATPVSSPTDVPTNTPTPSLTPTEPPTAMPTDSPSSTSIAGAILVIDRDSVPVRRQPAPNGDIIVIVSNRRLTITGISVDRLYYRVDYYGMEAWVAVAYGLVEGDPRYLPVIGAFLIIDNSSVPIRRVPTSSGDIIVIVSNRRLMITGISADRSYYRVDYEGREAWVAISYGMVEGDLTSVSLISDSE